MSGDIVVWLQFGGDCPGICARHISTGERFQVGMIRGDRFASADVAGEWVIWTSFGSGTSYIEARNIRTLADPISVRRLRLLVP